LDFRSHPSSGTYFLYGMRATGTKNYLWIFNA
jgi:hypothetical protein